MINRRARPNQPRLSWLPTGVGLALLAMLFLLSGCMSADASATADPYALYRPALKPEFQQELDNLGPAPQYTIDATLFPDELKLIGSAAIVVPNTSIDPWTHLVFRLYPMLEHYGGNLVIQSALVDGRPATFVYTNDNTALRIDLDKPLLPQQSVTVELTWRLEIPSWTDQPAVYALFGRSQQMISLPLFYPALAVYTDGPTLGAGQWWLTNGDERGDAAFSVASLFAVTLTLPSGWTPVTSGTEVQTVKLGDQTQHSFVTGPSREFLLHASPAFAAVSGEAYGTRVTSYYLPGTEAAAQAALKYAMQALRIYSDHFGEYPFSDMRVAPAPITFRGMEYPQAILLGVETYTRFRDKLEMLTAHEMAHQWWYQIVHNDPVAEPWLDEALAEFSMRLYMENTRGEDDAQRLVVQRWQTPVNSLKAKQQDTAVDQPVPAFLNGTQYETIVYAKGALFYDIVRDTIGVRRFDRFLQNYARKYRWGIVDSKQWLEDLRDLPDPALMTLFEEWIRQPGGQVQ
ncbi:M1 family metallopeptidase [Caldilinea sp.]|uniref:M1 family metallopeptidase n=1 Tax=Caldilinea sp. TaxID=2293560 RepID=UPI002C318117|nr:M1 family metallopeptidase [Anaerolineales bacterium]HQY94871.1 M1 family metallopeptidase [Caldilinea sp.]